MYVRKFVRGGMTLFAAAVFALTGCTLSLSDEGNRAALQETTVSNANSTENGSSGSSGSNENGSTGGGSASQTEENVSTSTTLTGTAWWDASNTGTTVAELSANTSITYTFTVAADGADCLVEAYDSASSALYLSTTSQLTAWGGLTALNEGAQTIGVLLAGNTYSATVSYDGTHVYVVYKNLGTDGTGNETLFVTASCASVTAPVYAHMVAEYGTFTVASKSATSDTVRADFLAAFSEITINTDSATKSFAKNASFAATGLSVTGTYGTTTLDLTSYATVDSSLVDTTVAGTYTVSVACGSASATYEVTVKAAALSELTLATDGVQTQYYTDGTHVPVLSTENLAITALYDDDSSATVAVSDATFSTLTATSGTQTVTVTYGDKNASYEVTVSALTEQAASWTGSIVGDDWWKVFTGTAASDGLQIASGKKLTTTMTVTATGGSNWTCAPDTILYAADEYSEYGVLRADNYGWGMAVGEACANVTATSDWDWDSFQSYILGSTLTITVANYGDGIADVLYDFTKTTDENTVTHYQYYRNIPVDADNLYANLTFENCSVTFGAVDDSGIPVSVTATESLPSSDITLVNDGYTFTVSGTPVTASGSEIAWYVDGTVQSETGSSFTLSGTKGTYYEIRVDVTAGGVTYSQSTTVLYQ